MENIKLEAGKYYRTQSGQKAFVAAIVPEAKTLWPVMGWVIEDGYNAQVIWKLNGQDVREGDANSLVAEWVEPKRIKGWVAIKSNGEMLWPDPTLHSSQLSARECSTSVVACIPIDALEGQGLNGSAS